jgi:hypothetical protein
MFGYDYEIIYKKGKENVVVDALSRKYEEEGSLFALSLLVLNWLLKAHDKNGWKNTLWFNSSKGLQEDPNPPKGYTW